MSLDHLIFDTSNVTTVEDTHSVGAYVRSSKSGALITNHSLQKPSSGSFAFVDGDVSVANDTITETAHGFQTGDKVQLTTTGVLPAGLALLTDYYVIRVDANTIKLAISLYNAEWNIPVNITAAAGGGTHTVTGFEVEMRALDVWLSNSSIQVTQGTSPWVIGDGGGSITVDAIDLDIRNLDYTQDNVAIKGATGNQLVVNADGSLNVNADISVVSGAEKAEDAASANGDIGQFILGIRQDTLANSVSADGDYAALKVDSIGALWTHVNGTVSVSDAALANTAIAAAAETLDVANTAQDIIVAPLSNRKYLWVYNNDNQKAYIGQSGVTSANGFPISPGSYMELRAGAAVDIEFVSAKLNHEIRTLELS